MAFVPSLAVIGFHAFPEYAPGGFVGVDLFFVISGYLISGIIFQNLERGSFSFADFYMRRIRRIFPALILVLIAVWLIGWYILLPDDFRLLGRDIAAGAGFASNIVLWQEVGYFDRGTELKPLLHLWSLGVEEQYYIVWPLVLYLAWKARHALPAIIIGLAAASFAFNVTASASRPADAFFLPHARFWELLVGGMLAVTSGGAFFRRYGTLASIVGMTMCIGSVFGLHNKMAFPGWWVLLPVGGAALLIGAGPSAWVNRCVLSAPPLVGVGLISYPLYLWHWPLLSFARIASPEPLSAAQIGTLVAGSFALALATYWLVERPIRFSLRRRAGAAAAALLAVMAAVLPLGAYTFLNQGFPNRFPLVFQGVATLAGTHIPAYRNSVCFLSAAQDSNAFAKECVDPQDPTAPLAFLWGDSHAAHLYPGLAELQKKYRFRVAQYTASSCPPIFDTESAGLPACNRINRDNLDRVRALKPDWVILAAQWNTLGALGVLATRVGETVAALKEVGVKNVLLVGTAPTWNHGLPRALYDYYQLHGVVPARMTFGLGLSTGLDDELRQTATALGAAFLSLEAIFCNPDGCMTSLGPTSDDLVAWDTNHLTVKSSRYVMEPVVKAMVADTK
jgi:peptidoglycan/LPS O-acetylase OafA/YrhL